MRACTNFALYFLNVFTFALAVQFSMINLSRTPFGVTAYILYHILSRLSIPFSKVFSLFFKVFFIRFMRSYPAAFLGSFIIIPLSSRFVNPFSETFLTLAALSMCTVFAPKNCARCTTERRASCIRGYFTIFSPSKKKSP